MNFIERALDFAMTAHRGQMRKFGNEPYIFHPIRVYQTIVRYGVDNPFDGAIALNHDTIEDCGITREQIQDYLGETVGDGVQWLTSPSKQHPNWKRADRKKLDREHLADLSANLQTIKYADISDNVPSMVANNKEFGMLYVSEKLADMEVMTEGNGELYEKLMLLLKSY